MHFLLYLLNVTFCSCWFAIYFASLIEVCEIWFLLWIFHQFWIKCCIVLILWPLFEVTIDNNNNNKVTYKQCSLKKLRCAAGICPSVLLNRCSFRCCAKVAVDSDERHRLVGRLFQMSGPETAKFLQLILAVHCTLSLPEAADLRCQHPASSTTGWQSSARYGGASPRWHLLTSIAILYFIR